MCQVSSELPEFCRRYYRKHFGLFFSGHSVYNPYLWPNRRNFGVFQEIEVEEHHPPSGVRDINLPEAIQFCSQDALRMHYRQITYEVSLISSDHYKNSSVIVDLAMGQIPRSTERTRMRSCQFKQMF